VFIDSKTKHLTPKSEGLSLCGKQRFKAANTRKVLRFFRKEFGQLTEREVCPECWRVAWEALK